MVTFENTAGAKALETQFISNPPKQTEAKTQVNRLKLVICGLATLALGATLVRAIPAMTTKHISQVPASSSPELTQQPPLELPKLPSAVTPESLCQADLEKLDVMLKDPQLKRIPSIFKTLKGIHPDLCEIHLPWVSNKEGSDYVSMSNPKEPIMWGITANNRAYITTRVLCTSDDVHFPEAVPGVVTFFQRATYNPDYIEVHENKDGIDLKEAYKNNLRVSNYVANVRDDIEIDNTLIAGYVAAINGGKAQDNDGVGRTYKYDGQCDFGPTSLDNIVYSLGDYSIEKFITGTKTDNNEPIDPKTYLTVLKK